jgi:uncharacterized protein
MPGEYAALRDRVDRFVAAVLHRESRAIACGPGCSSCCPAGLTLAPVEAAALGAALGVREDAVLGLAGKGPLAWTGPCALLGPDRLCTAYEARPLVCRTHGLPIRFAGTPEWTACDLNFADAPPDPSSILDAETLDTALFAVNLAFCRERGLDPLARVAIDRLAAAARREG